PPRLAGATRGSPTMSRRRSVATLALLVAWIGAGPDSAAGGERRTAWTPVLRPPAWLNEVFFGPGNAGNPDGDANGDGKVDAGDQFVEVVNTTSSVLDVSGWTLRSSARKAFAF